MPEIVSLHVRLDYGWITYISDAFFVFLGQHARIGTYRIYAKASCADPESCQRRSNFDGFFGFVFFMRRGRIQIQPGVYKVHLPIILERGSGSI